MKNNFNQRERFIRILLSVIIGGIGVCGYFDDQFLNIVMIGTGIFILATAIINFCPIYRFLGISTNKSRKMTY